jgi:hypothetical protein
MNDGDPSKRRRCTTSASPRLLKDEPIGPGHIHPKEAPRRILPVIALISRTQQRGSCSLTRCPSVPRLLFESESHFLEHEYEGKTSRTCSEATIIPEEPPTPCQLRGIDRSSNPAPSSHRALQEPINRPAVPCCLECRFVEDRPDRPSEGLAPTL